MSISTLEMSREQWLENRRTGIGGSDCAAILGLNPYATPYTVWAEKTGRLTEKEDNEAMRLGRDLEDYVASRFTEKTGMKVRRRNAILTNPAYPWALANVDRLIVGVNEGLEVKTTSALNLKKFKNGEYPDTYYTQCVHYMAVTGAERWHLAVLVLGVDLYTFKIERDEEEIKALMESEKEFWNEYVVRDVAPPVDGLKATGEAQKQVFNVVDDGEIDLIDLHSEIQFRQATKKQIETLRDQLELSEQRIKQAMGEKTVGYSGIYTVNWKPVTQRRLNEELLRDGLNIIDFSKYKKESTYRKFEIKEAKA